MTTPYETREELISALRYQQDAGIDVALLDVPEPDVPFTSADTLLKISPTIHSPPTQQEKSGQSVLPPKEMGEFRISASANSADFNLGIPPSCGAPDLASVTNLADLRDVLSRFNGCSLKKTASNLVFSDGNPDAPIMLIGEAPGRDEDRMGLPFVGESGQLLDKMLASVGFGRNDVYITNAIPWRPPGNRTPSSEEIEMLWPFLNRHIELKAPDIIVALGGSSAKILLQTTTGILKLRGTVTLRPFGGRTIPILATLHPAYLLRTPIQKRESYKDLLQLRDMADKLISHPNGASHAKRVDEEQGEG